MTLHGALRILAGILQILHAIIRRGYLTQCAGDDSRLVAVYPPERNAHPDTEGLAVRVIQQDRIGFSLLKHITLSPLPQRPQQWETRSALFSQDIFLVCAAIRCR